MQSLHVTFKHGTDCRGGNRELSCAFLQSSSIHMYPETSPRPLELYDLTASFPVFSFWPNG